MTKQRIFKTFTAIRLALDEIQANCGVLHDTRSPSKSYPDVIDCILQYGRRLNVTREEVNHVMNLRVEDLFSEALKEE